MKKLFSLTISLALLSLLYLLYRYNLLIHKHSQKILKIMQVYLECKNNFIPPLQTILSYRIQCKSPVEGYECRESKSYLDFIINTYDNPLADIYIFMHGHNKSWHFINPLISTMKKLINSEYIKEENFGGYQCYWNYIPTILINKESTVKLMNLLFKNTNVHINNFGKWSYPCCSTFFVHTNQIRRRPKSEYIQMIENLKEWSSKDRSYKREYGNKYDGFCGRIYEMMWNRILSNTSYVKLPPYCKTEEKLYCNLNPIDKMWLL